MKFELTDKQIKQYEEWYKTLPEADCGAIGGRITFSFTLTSIGDIIVVKDSVTDQEFNLTDYDSW